MLTPADLLRWGAWRPLAAVSRDPAIPHLPGLYRIRRIVRDDLDYIGQTGMGTMTLHKRLAMLRGVSGEVMPYRDPHTAGPALWALHHQTGKDFEVPIVPVEGSMRWRKRLQELAIFALDNYAHALPDMQIRRSTRSMRRCFERFRLLRITTYPPVDFATSSQIVA